MRISDWSSDVCSSDLIPKRDMLLADLTIEENRVEFTLIGSLLYLDPPDNVAYYAPQGVFIDFVVNPLPSEVVTVDERAVTAHELISTPPLRFAPEEIGRASWRERVCTSG